jgi:hypothetical protein
MIIFFLNFTKKLITYVQFELANFVPIGKMYYFNQAHTCTCGSGLQQITQMKQIKEGQSDKKSKLHNAQDI